MYINYGVVGLGYFHVDPGLRRDDGDGGAGMKGYREHERVTKVIV